MAKFTPLMIVVLFVIGTVLVNTVEGHDEPCGRSDYTCEKNEDCCSFKCIKDEDEMICYGDNMDRYAALLREQRQG
ncbi:hypothetical protein KQX54_004900 [Cotesia glomerata]|uniref:Uncharacterized protein n=1 Tax=Cotesia glomerata TaxID=32391 RepID=A0AAV7ILY3_COTGL|nr:hypothetical protein KQX54_004900 [Cotesia glomerata]